MPPVETWLFRRLDHTSKPVTAVASYGAG
ncbi:hypothetical protein HNQ71_003775 [Mesorhizobium sangaii]|uniref:Uncharacterized protein n=1 Tax=Mesorhizobium sangaii TaxID=505389 RepID=A0A841PBT3_9HYPH|nr:hypothetical protein [Mesorhizobium sangaii]